MIKNSYILKLNEIVKNNQEKDNFIFGICIGAIFLYYGVLQYLQCDYLAKESIFYGRLTIIGLIIMVICTIYPNIIDIPYFCIRKLVSIIGKVIFHIILTIIYFIFVFPIGMIMKLNKQKNIDSNFNNYIITKKRKNMKILEIFNYLFNKNYILMLPLIIILIFMGILLFFAQSSAVAPFIYTIF